MRLLSQSLYDLPSPVREDPVYQTPHHQYRGIVVPYGVTSLTHQCRLCPPLHQLYSPTKLILQSGCASSTTWVLGASDGDRRNKSHTDSEMQRRRFWASYLQSTFQADSPFPNVPTEGLLHTILPCGKSEFQLRSPRSSSTLKDTESTQSIHAELVRTMSLWSSVVFFIKQTGLNLASRLIEIQTLDGRIHEAWSKLDPSFQLDCAKMAAVPLQDLPKLLLLHVIYNQCLCSLHSSIVPLFS